MENNSLLYHKPVLVNEVLHYLNIQPHGVYLDVTFGSGGHTRAILEKEPTARVIALDWDTESLDTYSPALQQEFGDRLTFVWGNFAHMYKILKKEKIERVNGILADFGTSQMQIFERAGFSLFKDTQLDMRMSPSHHFLTAAQILNTFSEHKLCDIFGTLGEEPHAKKIARAVVQERGKKRFKKTGQLKELIERVVNYSSKAHHKKIHPATRVFQALRIYVNSELENIHAFLKAVPSFLACEGRVLCISFHSLEDRAVKDFFKEQESLGILEQITKKVVTGTSEEIEANPSARSAKLRVAQKIPTAV